jgi:sulfoxide reductase heme-binding subunit YedZ
MEKIIQKVDQKTNSIKLIDSVINNIKVIKKVLLAIAILMPVYVYFNVKDAKDFGGLALNLLILSLIIGPLGKIFKNNFMKLMMLIRGEIGILMASAALAHGVGILSNKMLQDMLSSATSKEMFTDYLPLTLGILAMWLTVPLLITSNAYLKEKMGTWWFRMHKLAYLIFILGALHGSFIKGGVTLNNFLKVLPLFVVYGALLLVAQKFGKK